ncbi:mechanosensitive ion channel family protein [Rhizobium puerariae]|uniref:Mechanosensitive ion channel family protein n=1 Tax=Rhizobium puerariae TaxID=1585791 RepID=A0ABV6AMH1_9HYPH
MPGAAGSLGQQEPLTLVVRQGQNEAEIKRVLDLAAQAGRPVTVKVEAAGNDQKAASSEPAMETSPEMAATNMGMATWDMLSGSIVRGATIALSGFSDFSTVLSMTRSDLAAEGSTHGRALFVALLAVLAGACGTLLLRFLVAGVLPHRHASPSMAGKFRRAALRAIGDLLSIAIFLAITRFTLLAMLDPGSVSFRIARGAVTAVVISTIYVTIGRFLFKPTAAGSSLVNIERPSWHFRMLVAYGFIGAFFVETIRLAVSLGLNMGALEGWLLIGNTALAILKLTWFIGGRKGIRAAFIGPNPGIIRRLVGNLLPDFYALTAVLIWLTGFMVAGTPDSARWSFAAGATQALLLILPILAMGAYALMDEFARHCEQINGAGLLTSMLASLRVVISGAVWVGGLHIITALWQPLMAGEAAALATGWIVWLERFSLAVVASWAVCTLIWRYFESIAPSTQIMLPGQEDDHAEKKPTSRLSTALPVVRNLALGAVLAVGGLLILSSLGINVAPLLAGFGVLGLALSFGSQALVRDIVSGIFFIADDAFRIGEYIDTGKLKGTVEQITVRSIRLRHHNGPIHTIPFGQISSVTNYSRDWGTIKFELRFERDANAETIRKAAKKVGLAMLEDPEFGPEFLLPLKMQGIQDITETSMVVRFKFTCRPGNPSILKREAMKRLIVAFKEAGLEFASNAVTVRSNATTPLEAAAAALSQQPAPAPIAAA